jgi:hypothetical protein
LRNDNRDSRRISHVFALFALFAPFRLRREAEVDDIAVLDDVFLAFKTHFAMFA